MSAEKYEGGNIPAHDKNTNGYSENKTTHGIHISAVFRGKKQGVGSIAMHKATTDGTEQEVPE